MTHLEVTRKSIWLWEVWAFQPKNIHLKDYQRLMSLFYALLPGHPRMESMERRLIFSSLKVRKNLVRNFVRLCIHFISTEVWKHYWVHSFYHWKITLTKMVEFTAHWISIQKQVVFRPENPTCKTSQLYRRTFSRSERLLQHKRAIN